VTNPPMREFLSSIQPFFFFAPPSALTFSICPKRKRIVPGRDLLSPFSLLMNFNLTQVDYSAGWVPRRLQLTLTFSCIFLPLNSFFRLEWFSQFVFFVGPCIALTSVRLLLLFHL